MSQALTPERFEKVVRAHLPHLPADVPLVPDDELAAFGLDSLTTVTLLVNLESEFDVSFPDETLTAATFATAANLWTVLQSLADRR
jgi:acyl carrier protein